MNDINKIIQNRKINNKLNYLIDIYNKLNNKNDEEIYNNFINKINKQFKKNPNLKYKITINKTNDCNGINDIFEVYVLFKDNKEYLVSPNNRTHNLDIYRLLDNKKILSLSGHEKYINMVRYFLNKKDYNEYLISADNNKIVIVWDITNNYNIKHKIFTDYLRNIYSCLLVFPPNNEDYIITSSFSTMAIKLYSLNNGFFIKYYDYTFYKSLFYLLSWYNKKNKKNYIICFSINNIIIQNLFEDEIYSKIINLSPGNGYIFNKDNNDYLCYND